jgi:hypothetical protein
VPALTQAAYAFGLLQIVWFAWVGVALLKSRPQAQVQPSTRTATPTPTTLGEAT